MSKIAICAVLLTKTNADGSLCLKLSLITRPDVSENEIIGLATNHAINTNPGHAVASTISAIYGPKGMSSEREDLT